jgi:CSLREA domain-containing protein
MKFFVDPATAARRVLLAALCVFTPAVLAVPTFTVNSTADGIDDDTSDGVCHTVANTCTLRAAIMQANRAGGLGATIVLPAGTYVLERPPSGSDGEDSGDLNLTTPASGDPLITISGAGASTTIIDAN